MSTGGIALQAQSHAVNLNGQGAAAVSSNALGFAQLQQLHQEAKDKNPAAILATAKQFEAMLLDEMLSTMSKTTFGSDLLGKSSGPMFQSLFTEQIAQTVAQGRGVGLASTLAQEIATRYHLHWDAKTAAKAEAANTPVTIPAAPTTSNVQNISAPNWNQPGQSLLQRAKAFVQSILPAVRQAAVQLDVSPVAILAQAALETGWGAHAPGDNLFGIKAGSGWSGSALQNLTHEFVDGVNTVEDASFRAYQNVAASVANYTQLLLNSPRYRAALGQGNNIAGFAQALQNGGYATDPNYATKITALAQGPVMQAALAGTGLTP
ncbi:flagellar assembly peptidoglycan hydrolase FlgJ [Acidithiobacillus sp. AMEEHan]|uniref:flagellar assembly peptidoglycan hydrolase FlgJ n=1 Tax=Acidithiobacillus sp. AMEEHan TaxID=2994951 RepID=UPI0027E3CA66|nr:flagellar assembly peptidoglycan hydrolase FlgJ [Acidithiobacillus sp. AMEEHan]